MGGKKVFTPHIAASNTHLMCSENCISQTHILYDVGDTDGFKIQTYLELIFTAACVKCRVAALKCLAVLHRSAEYIFWSFGSVSLFRIYSTAKRSHDKDLYFCFFITAVTALFQRSYRRKPHAKIPVSPWDIAIWIWAVLIFFPISFQTAHEY